MIHDLKPYPAYKDSGVPWLGEVPEHWKVMRLKAISSRTQNGSTPPTDSPGYYADEGLPWYGPSSLGTEITLGRPTRYVSTLAIKEGKVRPISPPALAVSVIGNVGRSALMLQRGATNQQITCFELRNDSCDPRFVTLQFRLAEDNLIASASSATIAILDSSKLRSTRLIFPPFPEQAAIACFLDHADRRIRRYIRSKQKLIQLLKEQNQAFIHSAVTLGLDPKACLKPSGVEWLGDVPEHWEVRRNGRLFVQRNETGFADLPILEVSLRTGVRVRSFENSERKQVMSDRDKYKRAVSGDIAYNMMRMWQGAVGVAPTDGLISPAYIVAKPLPGTESRYFIRLFRTAAYMKEIDKYSRGIVKDRNRLYWEDFKRMPSCYPPPHEQVMISDAIDHACEDIDMSVERIHHEIKLLQEYRTRLIADVVTGKLDVRDAAARLPDEAEEPEPLDEADTLTDVAEDATDDIDASSEEVEA